MVQVVECKHDLHEPVQHQVLGVVLAFCVLAPSVEIPALAVHHHDVEVLLAVQKGVLVAYNVGVPQLL